MTGAANHRGSSRQDFATPWEFVRAVERQWGPIAWDLAATAENAKAPKFITPEQNSFTVAWHELPGLLFLNPPFGSIAPWAKKCAEEHERGARIAFLVPASVDSNWFADHVFGQALVCPLNPRLCFDGRNVFPKPLMVCLYGEAAMFEPWRWKEQ